MYKLYDEITSEIYAVRANKNHHNLPQCALFKIGIKLTLLETIVNAISSNGSWRAVSLFTLSRSGDEGRPQPLRTLSI